jgi:hypothetical protein
MVEAKGFVMPSLHIQLAAEDCPAHAPAPLHKPYTIAPTCGASEMGRSALYHSDFVPALYHPYHPVLGK